MESPAAERNDRARRRFRRATMAAAVAAISIVLVLTFSPDRPPAITVVPAFPNLRIRLPVIFANAGDGTNRIFVGSQLGVIHVFPNDPDVTDTAVFLDIEQQVVCLGEAGLLGLAFHPRYRDNGEFFVFYSRAGATHTSILSRFRVSAEDPNQADVTSEEVILRIDKPLGDHNGGGLAFGPDGFLYLGVGDGGNSDEAKLNGQDRSTLLGSILRIDVDHRTDGRNYAIPPDNPFVGQDGVRAEIWAYGLRNVWRMAFDRDNGRLWAADVGQDHWEEVNLIVRGGNYGWNLREGRHPFGATGSSSRTDLIDPIWEYHHDVGKCVIGGAVYRGRAIPALRGIYICGDYVTNKAWLLRYDDRSGQVSSVSSLEGVDNMPIMTFGQDEAGEIYLSDAFGRILRLAENKHQR
ncbi:MAG: PQQ-dependent sugar dehydrogenase [Pirellulales bacterium]